MTDCAHLHKAVIGIIECSMVPDGYVDRLKFECRRMPPQRGFWSDGYPDAVCPCGEYKEKP